LVYNIHQDKDAMPKTLLLATENPGKVIELRALLANFQFDIFTPKNLGIRLEVSENGSSYAENAGIKALAYARESGLITLADDSGLEVDALNGQPGIYSARYAPWAKATDADRRQYLLANLSSFPRPWTACFRCSVAIANKNGGISYCEGECRGEIIPDERGKQGFGYDPIFLIPGIRRTMAELSMEDKNLISHRAHAIKKAIPILTQLFESSMM
jgi:XTP/dITP diphosphohydrolase